MHQQKHTFLDSHPYLFSFSKMLWILVSVLCIAIAYLYVTKPLKFWKNKGVKQTNPIPLFGDNWGTIFRTQSFAELVIYVYNMFPNIRYSGMYQFNLPTLVLKDPELLKQITVKDFDHFMDHRDFLPEDVDPLWSNNLFSLKGQRWRDMRSTLSPSFTSSRMKTMFVLISDCAESFVKHFLDEDGNVIYLEMKDLFTRFTNDIIASAAFGIHCDSLENRNNEFYEMGKEATDFSGIWKTTKFLLMLISPKVASILDVKLLSKRVNNFFSSLVRDTVTYREQNNVVRPDLIHLLMQARKGNNKQEEKNSENDNSFAATVEYSPVSTNTRVKSEITLDDITSQALIFFFAGFDSVSSLMCFMAYELAVNQDVQDRLIAEIDEVRDNDGKLTYESLLKMDYMDMVVSEALRKWPSAVAVDRVCTKEYTIGPVEPEEEPVHLEKGTVLLIPIFAFHRDPKYYPNPDKFDPERFNSENKHTINPYTYMPFGVGPRNCIGSRFALLETKALFYHILSHFKIVPIGKSTIPLKISKKTFNLSAEGGFWLGLERRVR